MITRSAHTAFGPGAPWLQVFGLERPGWFLAWSALVLFEGLESPWLRFSGLECLWFVLAWSAWFLFGPGVPLVMQSPMGSSWLSHSTLACGWAWLCWWCVGSLPCWDGQTALYENWTINRRWELNINDLWCLCTLTRDKVEDLTSSPLCLHECGLWSALLHFVKLRILQVHLRIRTSVEWGVVWWRKHIMEHPRTESQA